MSAKHKEKTLGEWAKRVALSEAEINKTGQERRQPSLRQDRPLQKVADWILDNDFAGLSCSPPLQDMERLEKEMRNVASALEKGEAGDKAKAVCSMQQDIANFWTEFASKPMPLFDTGAKEGKPPVSKHYPKKEAK